MCKCYHTCEHSSSVVVDVLVTGSASVCVTVYLPAGSTDSQITNYDNTTVAVIHHDPFHFRRV